jgi:Fe-Mn family superoxide dismutase
MIDDEFESTDALLAKLKEEAVGHFSNGWAWLVLDRDRLKVVSLHDADTPVAHDGMKPLLTLDVWEHAYYIDYRNDRPAFAAGVLGNIVNWEFVARNLDGEGVKRADQEA